MEKTQILTEIELYNNITEKNFKCKVGVLNGIRFNKLAKIETQYRNIKKEANVLYMMAQSDPETLKKSFSNNKDLKQFEFILDGIASGDYGIEELTQLFESSLPEIAQSNIQRRIEIIQTMIDESKLSDELKVLIFSEPNSEFWESQDRMKVIEYGDSFRHLLRK